MPTIIAKARQAYDQDREKASELADGGAFEQARRLLSSRRENIRSSLGTASEFAPLRNMVKGLDTELARIDERRAQKRAADAAHDQKKGFAARQSAFAILRQGFEPDRALGILRLAEKDLRTDEWRALVKADAERVAAMLRVRDGFLSRLAADPVGKRERIQLPSDRDATRDVTWTLKEVTAENFVVTRGAGRFKETHAFTEFTASELNTRLFSLRPPARSGQDEATMLLLGGDMAGALRIAGNLPAGDTFRQYVEREAAAQRLLREIRVLQREADGDPKVHLRLLPLVDRMIDEYRDTVAFALNSNGATPVIAQ